MNHKKKSKVKLHSTRLSSLFKASVWFGLISVLLFSSCLSQRPVFTNEKDITNEVKSLEPQWQKFKGAPYLVTHLGLSAGAGAVGFSTGDELFPNNPEKKENDNEWLGALAFSAGTFLVFDAVFFNKKKRKEVKEPSAVKASQYRKWLRKYNAKTGRKYVVFDGSGKDLLLIRKQHLAAYKNYKARLISLSSELNTEAEVLPDKQEEVSRLLADEKHIFYPDEIRSLQSATTRQEGIMLENKRKRIYAVLDNYLDDNQGSGVSYISVVQFGRFENQHSGELGSLDANRRVNLQEKANLGFNNGLEQLLSQGSAYLQSLRPDHENWRKLESWYSKFAGQYENASLFMSNKGVKDLKQEYLRLRKATVMASRTPIFREMSKGGSFLNIENVKNKYLYLMAEDEEVKDLLDQLTLSAKRVFLASKADKSTANIFTNLLKSEALSSGDLLFRIKSVRLEYDVSGKYLTREQVVQLLRRKGISVSEEADVTLRINDIKEYNKYTLSRQGNQIYDTNVIATILYAQLYTNGLRYFNGDVTSGINYINSLARSYQVKENELSRSKNGYTVAMNELLTDMFTKPFTQYSATPQAEWTKSIENIFENSDSFKSGGYNSSINLAWIKVLQSVSYNSMAWQSGLEKLGIQFTERDAYGIENPVIFHRIDTEAYKLTDDAEHQSYVVSGDANIILKDCLISIDGNWYRYPGSVYSHRRWRICVQKDVQTSKTSLRNEAIEDFTVRYLKN